MEKKEGTSRQIETPRIFQIWYWRVYLLLLQPSVRHAVKKLPEDAGLNYYSEQGKTSLVLKNFEFIMFHALFKVLEQQHQRKHWTYF